MILPVLGAHAVRLSLTLRLSLFWSGRYLEAPEGLEGAYSGIDVEALFIGDAHYRYQVLSGSQNRTPGFSAVLKIACGSQKTRGYGIFMLVPGGKTLPCVLKTPMFWDF